MGAAASSFALLVLLACSTHIEAFLLQRSALTAAVGHVAPLRESSVFESESTSDTNALKMKILQISAALDRGQSYNPTSGEQYSEPMAVARSLIDELCTKQKLRNDWKMEQLDGEWELVFSTVPHGIFRSSPFFLAIQDAYAAADNADKANLFFKLHELQTCSWGVSKIGRVAQVIDSKSGVFVSEFDTSIFSLTVIPLLGWGKLLPTFGGCVITVSKMLSLAPDGKLSLEVDYTTAKKVPGLSSLPGDLGVGTKIPVGAIWKLLPWNRGRAATANIWARYVDADFRVMQDLDDEFFVYTRPVFSRLDDLSIEY